MEARHPYLSVGGRHDGTALFVLGQESHLVRAEDPGALERGELYLFGVCHRWCLERARSRLRRDTSWLPATLPTVQGEEIDELPEEYHLSPTGRFCPFCGADEGLTDEHVWPKWVSRALKRFPGAAGGARPFVIKGERDRRTSLIDVCAPVCALCNNRWLSSLEQDAQRLLEPMILGRESRLDVRDQRLAATWAVKTALMIDLSSGEPIVPLGYYRDLAHRRAPPPSVRVWIAGYAGPAPAWASRKGLWIEVPRNAHPNAFAVTLTAGALILQVAGHFVRSGGFNDGRRQYDDSLRQIFPDVLDSITWPPALTVLDHDALELLSSSFTDSPMEP